MSSPVSVTVEARLRWTVFTFAAAAFFLSFFHRVAPGARGSFAQPRDVARILGDIRHFRQLHKLHRSLDRSAGGAANAVTLELFRPALLVLGGFTLIGVIGALFIRETRCRNIWSPTPLKP